MPVGRHHEVVPERVQTAELLAELRWTRRRRPPGSELQIVALGERRQVHLDAVPERILQRAHDAGARPAQRLRQGLGVVVRCARSRPGPPRLGQDHPRAVGKRVGRPGQLVEQERRRGLEPVGREPVRHPAEQVRDPLVVDLRGRGARPSPQRVIEDQLARRTDLGDVDRARRQLRRGYEATDRVDLVAPELQSHGPALLGREHIQHPAADRELPPVLDDVHAEIPELHQPFREHVGRRLPTLSRARIGSARPAVGAIPCKTASTGATTTRGPPACAAAGSRPLAGRRSRGWAR